jgi:hypothetical protein
LAAKPLAIKLTRLFEAGCEAKTSGGAISLNAVGEVTAMTRRSEGALHSFAPRGMRRPAAAYYIGVSPTKFDEMVNDGRMPPPKVADGCVVWDRTLLDIHFEALPDRQAESGNPWD